MKLVDDCIYEVYGKVSFGRGGGVRDEMYGGMLVMNDGTFYKCVMLQIKQ